ncbi:putative DNA-binding protein (MmcQ/YjbR family) [Balneicella halophila]|uniref:Putative DNA-binding protein (MmcQ/YjbR family) n=1 Tax=Balneicella halophila TaxID=1537566 RepID=A0A7L4URR1_BALHA|nr:MmcQ/YjbR family DNA-binding protein [Balneicella halophila]PVX52339.1 putative DNA-binding protein (MmcQ/YjbR family) [Balneicella halophila]
MNIEDLHNYCLQKRGVSESFPFDEDTLVFKVMNRMFTLTSLSNWEKGEATINLKCEPGKARSLRERYTAITPGYHMNKKHWNTVHIDGTLSDDFLKEMIDDSYQLIVKSLPKKAQKELESL